MLDARDGTAGAEALDFGGTEPELFENLFVVFADFRGALGGYFRDAVHLNRAADRELQLPARSFERNDDVIRSQLRIVDDFLWPAHGAEGDMNAIEDFVPMRHRLRAENLVQNRGQLWHVLHQLGRIGEPRIRQEIRPTYGLCQDR